MTAFIPPQRIVVVSDGKNGPSATQKISFAQPFAPANGGDSRLQITFEQHLPKQSEIKRRFDDLKPDLLILSRYTSQRGVQWIDLARAAGIPVIYHIDDDLLAVPRSLGEDKFIAYNKPERLQALRDNIEGCDLLYVSTRALVARMREHGIRVPVVGGDIYCSVSPPDVGALLTSATGPVIGYMGTGGHSADLAMIMPAILAVMERFPDLQFEIFGTIEMPKELLRFGSRIRHLPPVADYNDFIPYLRTLGWWIGLAPLEDNTFNSCKADTKWVEYSLAGMAVIASDLPVYHRACADGAGILAGSVAAWNDAMCALLLNPAKRAAMTDLAQQKLRNHYSHDRLRNQILDIIEQAVTILPPARPA